VAVTADELRKVTFLAPLRDKDLKRLASGMSERSLAAGENAVEQGTSAIAFFAVLDGELSVLIDGSEVRRLEPGDHFGEIALIVPHATRSATVKAVAPSRLAAMSQWNFQGFIEEHPEVHWPLLVTLARRLSAG
jgi:CRP-like cAMP-binding protein